MALVGLEGIASNIRTDTSVQGSMRRGKGNISTTTKMNFLLNGKAVYAHFGEAMSVNDAGRFIVAGVQKSNGLNALAYKNLTYRLYGEGGGLTRLVGLAIFAPFLIVPLLQLPIGIWVWWMGRRAKKASRIAGRYPPCPIRSQALPDLSSVGEPQSPQMNAGPAAIPFNILPRHAQTAVRKHRIRGSLQAS